MRRTYQTLDGMVSMGPTRYKNYLSNLSGSDLTELISRTEGNYRRATNPGPSEADILASRAEDDAWASAAMRERVRSEVGSAGWQDIPPERSLVTSERSLVPSARAAAPAAAVAEIADETLNIAPGPHTQHHRPLAMDALGQDGLSRVTTSSDPTIAVEIPGSSAQISSKAAEAAFSAASAEAPSSRLPDQRAYGEPIGPGQASRMPDQKAYEKPIGPEAKIAGSGDVWVDRLLGGDHTHGLGIMDAAMMAYIAPKIWQSVKETGGSDAEAFGSAAMDAGLQVAGQAGGHLLGRAIGGMLGSAGGPVGTMIGQMVGNMVAGEVSNAILSNAAEGRMKRKYADQVGGGMSPSGPSNRDKWEQSMAYMVNNGGLT